MDYLVTTLLDPQGPSSRCTKGSKSKQDGEEPTPGTCQMLKCGCVEDEGVVGWEIGRSKNNMTLVRKEATMDLDDDMVGLGTIDWQDAARIRDSAAGLMKHASGLSP